MIDQHNYYLEKLLNNLSVVNEDPKSIEWIFSEPSLFHKGSFAKKKLCDILLGYYDKSRVVIEVKRSPQGREKAIEQLTNGAYLLNTFGYSVKRSKIVYYCKKCFEFEEVRINGQIQNS